MDRFYLDCNATSPLSVSVTDWLKSGDVIFANPSSQHNAGKATRKCVNEARSKIFATFGKDHNENHLFFHSGATEAVMSFAISFSELARSEGKKLLICYSSIDHPCVTSLLERNWGSQVGFFELKHRTDLSYDHEVNLQGLKDKKAEDPNLIILYHHLWVHNETGLVSPLSELAPFKEIFGLYLHIDAVQAPGKIIDWRELSVGDIWSFSAHKFGALKGIGFSLLKKEIPYRPLFIGGGQQHGLRGGTENPQGIQSIALALEDLLKVDIFETTKNRDVLEKFMENHLSDIGGVFKPKIRNSNTIYFYLNEVASDIALALFDLNGIMISAGSACSSGAARPSPILTQLGMGKIAKNGLRLSVCFEFDKELLNKIQGGLEPVFNKLKS